jgi:hypothetical protein
MKCNDCGRELTPENCNRRMRTDVCKSCWTTREELVTGKIVSLNSVRMREIQRRMSNGDGTAAKYIDSLRVKK